MRIVSGMMLAAALSFAAGCGKSDAPGEPKPLEVGTTTPVGEAPKVAPPPPAIVAAWEMDPAKHAIPTGPVSGKLRGEAVAFEVEAERDSLRFRFNKSGSAISAVEIHLSNPEKSTEGLSLVVKPDQMAGLDVPNVIVRNPANPGEEPKIHKAGYALTLTVGKREKGKVSGKLFLSLPDEQKSFVAGTFNADWIRPTTELPGADDVPFVHGKFTVAGATDTNVWFGYVRTDPFDAAKGPAIDVVGTDLKPGASHVRSDNLRPMAVLVPGANGLKDPARYELTKLEPGRYWIFATVKGGPLAWKWVNVDATTQVVLDLAIEAGAFGSLELTAPGGSESIAVVPASEPGKPWPEGLVSSAASIADLYVDNTAKKSDPAKPLTVKFPRLAPGKYEVWSGDAKVDVEVKANETAKVELKKK